MEPIEPVTTSADLSDAEDEVPPGNREERQLQVNRYRVVHTSGERLVASKAEASAFLMKFPGARAFRASMPA